jgi:hypothetical protein
LVNLSGVLEPLGCRRLPGRRLSRGVGGSCAKLDAVSAIV